MAKELEVAPIQVEEGVIELEMAPFQEQESKIVGSLTEQYAKKTEINDNSKKVVDGFLAGDAEKVYREFALEWFNNNEEKLKEEGKVIPPGASNEWKINMVLSPKERGGMGAIGEIREPEYKKMGDEMDKIGVLRNDMKKDNVPPETPFLLLNYLYAGIAKEAEEIEMLRKDAVEKEDASASIMANNKEKELAQRFTVMKELAEKVMGESLNNTAEKKVVEGGFQSRDKYIEQKIERKKDETEAKTAKDLLNKEWQEFDRLNEKQKREFCSKLGVGRKQTVTNEGDFAKILLDKAKESGIEGPAFYGLLAEGYKPYNTTTKGFWLFKNKLVLVPKKDGSPKEIPVKECEVFIKEIEDKYDKKINEEAQRELEISWDQEHNEKIREEVVNRVKELAQSPEMAEGGIEKVYEKARERIVAEYVRKRLGREPKTKEQLAALEKKFENKGRKKDVNRFMADVLFRKGRLEKIGDSFSDTDKREIGGFLRDYGINADIGTTRGFTKADYAQARKTQTGFFNFIMRVAGEAFKPKVKKQRKAKK